MVCAVAASHSSTALDGHLKIYRLMSFLSDDIARAMELGQWSSAQRLMRSQRALARICVKAAEHLGPQPRAGLTGMTRYICSTTVACITSPSDAVFNKSAADGVLAALVAESPSGGGGGARRGRKASASAERADPEPRKRAPDHRDRDRDYERRTPRR